MAIYDIAPGDVLTFACDCGRDCPLRWDRTLDTIVIDHGGEAVYVMPQAEWHAANTLLFQESSLQGWLDRVHTYEAT